MNSLASVVPSQVSKVALVSKPRINEYREQSKKRKTVLKSFDGITLRLKDNVERTVVNEDDSSVDKTNGSPKIMESRLQDQINKLQKQLNKNNRIL